MVLRPHKHALPVLMCASARRLLHELLVGVAGG